MVKNYRFTTGPPILLISTIVASAVVIIIILLVIALCILLCFCKRRSRATVVSSNSGSATVTVATGDDMHTIQCPVADDTQQQSAREFFCSEHSSNHSMICMQIIATTYGFSLL